MIHLLTVLLLLPVQEIAVDGRFSRFTLLLMTYESRLAMAQAAVRHYSRCPSTGEVLIIWNAGVVSELIISRK